MLRKAITVNIFLSLGTVAFSIYLQQLTGMAVRASGFQAFKKMTNEERDHILASAAQVVWVCIIPLVVSNIFWIAIACIALFRKPPVNDDVPS